ncbi:glutathione S-transferase family protein [Neisseria perflava]|uniref:glutathione S-transferase family protein n=1 Tax=Neisseria perflava TaxID=33053 RepID=UPI0020A13DE8|nr:glutathione S-transferase N-terminal domain-containing protein [Neisseria perflava]MCP1661229.1 glutathione S-transferase [Neisseria perflava]MCP1773281.1 glutathione S-transferase [Neisseria perflava]
MLKLYYMQGACPLVPHTALFWTKADFEAVKVTHDELKTPEFLALNPVGSVPVLQEGDWTLTQNVAILDYLNDRYPEANIYGSGDIRARAKARQWLAFANADVYGVFGTIFAPNQFIDGEGETSQVRARAELKAVRLLTLVDEALNGQDYLTGELTIADVYFYVILRWAKAVHLDLGGLGNLEGFYLRVESNAGVQSALKQQGLLVD